MCVAVMCTAEVTIPVGFAQCNIRFSGLPCPTGAEITFGIQVAGGSTPSSVGSIVATIVDGELPPALNDFLIIDDVLVKFGPDDVGPSAVTAIVVNGDRSAAAGPPNTAALVQKSTSLGGREGRGRFYLPGIVESDVDSSGNIGPAGLTLLQDAMTGLFDGLAFANLDMFLLHNSETAPTLVNALTVSPKVATQRRRLRR